MNGLAPFWRYYGGKNRAARLYPAPEHDSIVEPFAGAAGYACRYPHKKVVLVDKSPIVAGIWKYLVGAREEEVRRLPDIPDGGTVDDVPAWVPQEARWLMGFWCNNATVTPCKRPSKWVKAKATPTAGWGDAVRSRIARQLSSIRHWRIIEGDYHDAPDVEATWYVDPPYANKAGSYYPHQPNSFQELARWCRSRRGLVMVCENAGAAWLPFRPLAAIQSNPGAYGKKLSHEVIWTNRPPRLRDGGQRVFTWGAA